MVSKKAKGGEAPTFSVFDHLRQIYEKRLLPIEESSLFGKFGSTPMTAGELKAKPIVLLLGQYSTGKTSFIQHLLGRP